MLAESGMAIRAASRFDGGRRFQSGPTNNAITWSGSGLSWSDVTAPRGRRGFGVAGGPAVGLGVLPVAGSFATLGRHTVRRGSCNSSRQPFR